MDENEAKRREVMKRKKHKRSRGLSFEDAEEVIVMFSKVAVVKQRVSTQEQVSAVSGCVYSLQILFLRSQGSVDVSDLYNPPINDHFFNLRPPP